MSLLATIQKLNKRYGDGTIAAASKCDALFVTKIPTGSLALDVALRGGWPQGRMIELSGVFSAGKTSLIFATAREFQRLSEEHIVIFIDAENALDRNWLEKSGVNMDRFLITNLRSGEDIGQAIKEILFNADKPLLLIVDSLAHVIPMKEIEDDQEDSHPGIQARLINKMLRVITPALRRSLTDPNLPMSTVMFLNQIREKVAAYGRDNETTPGGRGKEFATSVHVKLKNGGFIYGTGESKIGKKAIFEVKKSKTGPPAETGEFDLYFKPGSKTREARIDNVEALIRYGVLYEVITKKGGGSFTFNSFSSPTSMQKIRGEDNLKEFLRSHPTEFRALSLEVIRKCSCGYATIGKGYTLPKRQKKSKARAEASRKVRRQKTTRER